MKLWYESKTLWVSAITFVIGVLLMFQEQFAAVIEQYPKLAGALVVFIAGLQALLRFITNTGLIMVRKPPAACIAFALTALLGGSTALAETWLPVPPDPRPTGNIGEDSYRRAEKLAKQTGEPQPVLYVFGDKHAQEVAVFISELRGQGLDPPHIIDLERAGQDVRSDARQSRNETSVSTPYLQTVHAGGDGYGPLWREMDGTSPEHYVSWLQRSRRPARSGRVRVRTGRGMFGRSRYGYRYSSGVQKQVVRSGRRPTVRSCST